MLICDFFFIQRYIVNKFVHEDIYIGLESSKVIPKTVEGSSI